jgi:hypothetical protein
MKKTRQSIFQSFASDAMKAKKLYRAGEAESREDTGTSTRSGPCKPIAAPATIPVIATNDASASVETPVRPWPIEHP